MKANTLTRREAMKVLGVAAGSVMMGSVLVSTGCKPQATTDSHETAKPEAQDTPNEDQHYAIKRLIFYFTGTGNSLYVAKQLSDQVPEHIVSIPQVIHQNDLSFEAEEIGIVYPVYGHMPPNMVRNFIQKAKLKCRYLFSVLTYGKRKCNAVETWDQICQKAGYKSNYIATLLMVDNWLPVFDMDEERKLDKKTSENLARIQADLASHKNEIEPVTDQERQEHEEFLKIAGPTFKADGIHAKAEEWFTVTDKCVSCSVCTRLCPKSNYKIEIEKAVSTGECELCFACIHGCPHKAIVVAAGEKNPNARYRHPEIHLSEIQRANQQRH